MNSHPPKRKSLSQRHQLEFPSTHIWLIRALVIRVTHFRSRKFREFSATHKKHNSNKSRKKGTEARVIFLTLMCVAESWVQRTKFLRTFFVEILTVLHMFATLLVSHFFRGVLDVSDATIHFTFFYALVDAIIAIRPGPMTVFSRSFVVFFSVSSVCLSRSFQFTIATFRLSQKCTFPDVVVVG